MRDRFCSLSMWTMMIHPCSLAIVEFHGPLLLRSGFISVSKELSRNCEFLSGALVNLAKRIQYLFMKNFFKIVVQYRRAQSEVRVK